MIRRLALCAALQCFAILACCQSPAITPKSAQAPSVDPSSRLFDLNISRLGLTSPLAGTSGIHSCGSDSVHGHASARAETNKPFHLPCVDLNAFSEVAQIDEPASSKFVAQWPGSKSIPIPTQWPGAKFKQIPTTWPNLKMLQITEHNPASAPAK